VVYRDLIREQKVNLGTCCLTSLLTLTVNARAPKPSRILIFGSSGDRDKRVTMQAIATELHAASFQLECVIFTTQKQKEDDSTDIGEARPFDPLDSWTSLIPLRFPLGRQVSLVRGPTRLCTNLGRSRSNSQDHTIVFS
jgi:hypothetical protein